MANFVNIRVALAPMSEANLNEGLILYSGIKRDNTPYLIMDRQGSKNTILRTFYGCENLLVPDTHGLPYLNETLENTILRENGDWVEEERSSFNGPAESFSWYLHCQVVKNLKELTKKGVTR